MKIKYFVLLGILWGACTSRTNQTITPESKDMYVLAETPNGVDTLAILLAGRKYNLKGRNGKISFMKIDKNDFYLPAKYFLEQDGDDIWLVEKGSYVLQGKLPEGAVNKEVFLIER